MAVSKESAYDYLVTELTNVGLESLAQALLDIITEQKVPTTLISSELQKLPAYTTRFPANEARKKAGLRPLTPAEYFQKEEDYRELMQNYGLPSKYYLKSDPLASQPMFDKLISGNVDSVTLEKRLLQGIDEIQNKPSEYLKAIQDYYPEVERGDILAYVLDPKNALSDIKSKVAAAQIGGEYLRAGAGKPGSTFMAPSVARAEELAKAGVTAEKARIVAQAMPEAERGTFLSSLEGTPTYGQKQFEEELYGLGGAAEARKQRERLVGKEAARFSGTSGLAGGALARDRAGLI